MWVAVRSHIFPLKLHSLIAALDKNNILTHYEAIESLTNSPDDGCDRFFLLSSELTKAADKLLERKEKGCLRKRLALPRQRDLTTLAKLASLELYDVDGTLLYAMPLVQLPSTISMAVEVDLMATILQYSDTPIVMS